MPFKEVRPVQGRSTYRLIRSTANYLLNGLNGMLNDLERVWLFWTAFKRPFNFCPPLILTEYIDLICILELSFAFNQPLKISTFFEVKPKKSFQKNTQNAQPCLPPWAWRQNELWQTQDSSSEERMVAFILSLDQSDTYKRILTSFELKNWVLIQLNCGFFICSKSRSNKIL